MLAKLNWEYQSFRQKNPSKSSGPHRVGFQINGNDKSGGLFGPAACRGSLAGAQG